MPGIGEKRKKQLLKHFGSVKKMKEASIQDFQEAGIPKQTAELLMEALKNRLYFFQKSVKIVTKFNK